MLSPHFWKVIMTSSSFQGLMPFESMISTTICVSGIMICVMCTLLCVVCKMISIMIHVPLRAKLSQSKFGKLINFPNSNLEISLTCLI